MGGESGLNQAVVAERLRFAGLFARQALRAGRRAAMRPVLRLLDWPATLPTRLLIAPQDIRTADPTVASDIYAGYFAFGGKVVNAHGQSPFDIEPPTDAWAEALHGFSWLRHMRAADTSLARANARALVEDWMGQVGGDRHAVAWRPRVVARRVLSWLSQSPVILEGADGLFYRRLMRSLGRQGAMLYRHLGSGLVGEDRLWAALALAEINLCADASVPNRRGSRAFLEELDAQFLGDGGHVGRNPGVLVDLLMDLLPLRQAYAARGAEVPPPLLSVIDRLMPILRMFRHPDGTLALFNGMGVTPPEALATVLAYDDAHAMPLSNAPYSGYQRVELADAVLICDTGKPPPLAFSKQAHAGALSFEFSSSGHKVVINCGAPDPGRRAQALAARSTAAHSTLVLADRSSAHVVSAGPFFADLDGALAGGPVDVPVVRRDTGGFTTLEASHDGYAAQGLVHRRVLVLAPDGTRLTGEDHLADTGRGPAGSLPFAVRFHLHPAARSAFAADGRAVSILLPNGETWLFEAGGLPIEIEESILFASAEGPRRTEQMVVQASTGEVRVLVWSLTRQAPG